MKDLTVSIENRPGTLADMSEALGNAGINIEGICGFPCEGKGVGHVLVEDATRARSAIEKAGGKVEAERDVLILEIVDKPGALGERTRRIANAGVNVDLLYLATRTRVVLGADDLDQARKALES